MKIGNLDPTGYINRGQFVAFHNKLSALLEAHYKAIGGDYHLTLAYNQGRLREIKSYFSWVYGKGVYKGGDSSNNTGSKLPTIESLYNESEQVKSFRKQYNNQRGSRPKKMSFENQIYEMRRHFSNKDKEGQPYTITDPEYLYGIFLLVEVGLQDPEALKEKGYWSSEAYESKGDSAARLNDLEWVHYLGMYFSVISFKVKYFLFDISYFPSIGDHSTIYVKEQGIRSLELIKNESIYEGKATRSSSGHYFASLFQQNSDDILNVIWNPDSPAKTGCFRASFQGVSKHKGKGRLLSLEATLYTISKDQRTKLLENTDKEAHILDLCEAGIRKDIEQLALYHSFQRRTIASRVGYIPRMDENDQSSDFQIRANRNLVRDFGFLPGVYRILQFGFKRGDVNSRSVTSIIQSKLQIERDGTALLNTLVNATGYDELQPLQLKCVLNPSSEPSRKKICVYAYYPGTLNISNFAILDFNSATRRYTGIFSSVGFNNLGVVGGYMVFTREKGDRTNFDPLEITPSNVDEFIKNEQLTELYAELLEVWQRKSKKLP